MLARCHRVKWDEVDVTEHAFAKLYKRLDMLVIIVNPLDRSILERWSPSGNLSVMPYRLFQTVDRYIRNTRHEGITCVLDCRM